MRLEHKTAFITGGNSGIGLATALVVDGGQIGASSGAPVYRA
jgi:NAD(P)-dependent dehydrogenase (short-subunit alcohol dehydrogenase family)